jgi:hypothetical protein
VVVVRAIEVGRNVHALYPHLAIHYGAVGIDERGFAHADALYFGSGKDNACREGLDEEVFERGFLILDIDRTLLPD